MSERPITRRLWAAYEASHRKTCDYEAKILARLDYVIRRIYREFGSSVKSWVLEDNNAGLLIKSDVIVGLDINSSGFSEEPLIILNGKEIEISWEIPRRWLFENFESELVEGRRAFLAKLEKEKAKSDLDPRARALKKLTKQERVALGLE